MAQIGRNQLCPCGSGKKYKKCCINQFQSNSSTVQKHDELDLLMKQGFSLSKRKESASACDVWLELWNSLKSRFKSDFETIEDAEEIFSGCDYLFNWCQDFEVELNRAGMENPEYYQKRIVYCNEFCSIFTESDDLLMHNMKRAAAESHFAIGNIDDGNRCFEELIELYPQNVWGYIGWGDMYCRAFKKDIKPDFEKAEQLYKMALDNDVEDIDNDVNDRLDALKYERDAKA